MTGGRRSALLLAASALGSCSQQARVDAEVAPTDADAAPAAPGLSLFDALIRGELTVLRPREVEAPAPADVLLDETFDRAEPAEADDARPLPAAFATGVELAALARGDAVAGPGGAYLATSPEGAKVAWVTRAAAGLITDVPLSEDEAARVVVRARRESAADGTEAGFTLRALAGAIRRGPDAMARHRKLRMPLVKRQGDLFEANLAAGGDWQEIELLLRPYPGRTGLRVSLFAGASGLMVDGLRVERIAPDLAALAASRDPDDRSRDPAGRRVRLGPVMADCLLLAASDRMLLDLDVPSASPRFEAGVAVVGRSEGDATHDSIRITIDGEPWAEWRAAPAKAAAAREPFTPWTVSLARFAGRRVRFEIAADASDSGAVRLLADPRVLGATVAGATPPPSLLLISIDTLRADHVGCYGSTRTLTPAIDAVAAGGTRFARLLAASTWTLPSHASLFTGQWPETHGAVDLAHRLDARRSPGLASFLRERGHATAAFTGGVVLDPTFGCAAGFSAYSTRDPGIVTAADAAAGADPLAPALDWIGRRADQPFFAFVHTYVAHNYEPRREEVERLYPGRAEELLRIPRSELEPRLRAGDPQAAQRLAALYAAAVAQADRDVVARLLAHLDALGLADRTIVAIVSDHGEEFLEHGGALHGDSISRELDHVPWVMRGPAIPRGRVVEAPASHVDVLPTLLARLGIEPPPDCAGLDRLAAQDDGDGSPRPMLTQVQSKRGGRWDALLAWPWKLVRQHRSEATRAQLFHVEEDPLEREDRGDADAPRSRELGRLLDRELARLRAARLALDAGLGIAADGDAVDISRELFEDLEGLGYVEGDGEDGEAADDR